MENWSLIIKQIFFAAPIGSIIAIEVLFVGVYGGMTYTVTTGNLINLQLTPAITDAWQGR